jgi:selenoprotein W-related protein
LTETVLLEYKQEIEEFTLVPSSGGVFEVIVDGAKIYSKNETGEFPNEDNIVRDLGQQ